MTFHFCPLRNLYRSIDKNISAKWCRSWIQTLNSQIDKLVIVNDTNANSNYLQVNYKIRKCLNTVLLAAVYCLRAPACKPLQSHAAWVFIFFKWSLLELVLLIHFGTFNQTMADYPWNSFRTRKCKVRRWLPRTNCSTKKNIWNLIASWRSMKSHWINFFN